MPRFAANLTMLYNQHDFLDRFEAAARDGFRAVEFMFPYPFAAAELAKRLTDHGLQQVLINAPPGDWDKGERGLACQPGREPDLGELHHGYLFDVIDEVAAQCNWQGWIGCEYRPARGMAPGATTAGLGWLRARGA